MDKPEFVQGQTSRRPSSYSEWLQEIRQRVRDSQAKAAVRVNIALLEFYWDLGRDIVERDAENAYGKGFIKQLSLDLKAEFPDQTGFSLSNLKYARKWYSFYREEVIKSQRAVGFFDPSLEEQLEKSLKALEAKVPEGLAVTIVEGANSPDVAQTADTSQTSISMPRAFGAVPWGHHIQIVSKCSTVPEALFYLRKSIEGNWSRTVLVHELSTRLYERPGKAISNYAERLPAPQGELAQELLKDPYCFDFLSLREGYQERDLEAALVQRVSRFLLELGHGFAFVGRQMELRIPGGDSYFPDLIFYHTKLKCYVVVELKVVEFAPEHAGKLNFYISAADELLKASDDNPSIGLLICRTKSETVVDWTLRGTTSPIGVAEYELSGLVDEAVNQWMLREGAEEYKC